ncbi:MAG TPA: ATP-dependent DNA helicase [Synergistales bacterium]|nr:ATP-dependent DNA helicase [Synergistales bacterium]
MKKPSMKDVFSRKGLLSQRFPGFEHRPQQEALAERVMACLDFGGGGVLLAEAPTGTGKTHALLVPAVYWCLEDDRKILFLTSGIPLQEQIVKRDLPDLCDCLGVEDLSYGLIKGKANYLCRLRGKEMSERELLAHLEPELVLELVAWMEKTETGDFSELALPPGHPVISALSAASDACRGNGCPFRESCFLRRVLQQAQEWDIIVANYHLFFSYSASTGRGFPVPCDAILCDEAHRLTEAARSAASLRATGEEWARVMDFAKARVFPRMEWISDHDRQRLALLADEVKKESERLFHLWKKEVPAGRIFTDEAGPPDGPGPLQGLAGEILEAAGEPPEKNGADDRESAALLHQWRDSVADLSHRTAWCARVDRFPLWAYWWDGRGINSSPTFCGDLISDWFFAKPLEALVAVSATMAIGEDFSFWEQETGLQATERLVLDSPFELDEQMSIWVVDLGLAVTDDGYDDLVARIAEQLCDDNDGSTLVLLSSLRLLRAVSERLRSKERPYRVLEQGELPRSELLRLFRQDLSSVLVGSVSFREGIDVPGEGLTQVIIDRIPFPHPTDPVLVTRKILEGPDMFFDIVLPRAKLLLKQAAGRLIRSKSDRGRVVILDGRVLSKRGWRITDALPGVKYRRVEVELGKKE